MFEVEQKFILSEEDIERLVDGAEFLGEKTFTDTYFDTAEFALTKNDMWLRKRGEEFELKIPMREVTESRTNQYQEIEGEDKIREVFSIAPFKSFVEDIAALGHDAFCVCTTTRKKYQKEGFVIDLDLVEYGDFSYALGEIELLVEQKAQMAEAVGMIEKFAEKNGLKNLPVRGKVIEYLKRKKPEHYRALVAVGVVIDE